MEPVDASHYYYALDDLRGYRRVLGLRDLDGEGKDIEWRQHIGHKGISKNAIAYPIEVSDSRPSCEKRCPSSSKQYSAAARLFSPFMRMYLIEESQKLMKLVQKNYIAASSIVDALFRPMSDSLPDGRGCRLINSINRCVILGRGT